MTVIEHAVSAILLLLHTDNSNEAKKYANDFLHRDDMKHVTKEVARRILKELHEPS